jgi:hypothetical protein
MAVAGGRARSVPQTCAIFDGQHRCLALDALLRARDAARAPAPAPAGCPAPAPSLSLEPFADEPLLVEVPRPPPPLEPFAPPARPWSRSRPVPLEPFTSLPGAGRGGAAAERAGGRGLTSTSLGAGVRGGVAAGGD